ncbi:hypothetical protein PGT21_013524 [Puccinia graminis f. sp. tritici]|uniref:Uncharacterized protein n=1 Tax=Puccinia graminis f. sp. tritici TaxID=56615 RepID=A0A5B0LLR8_PUCGR|nr:hypothetical protein PGT21_013524 [Puccinia graminis f. sp. tritici]KAA1104958.1 hypothetical protein PGTUg99_009004 [Puccinia graminis f. sp. tritici]
MNIPYKVSGGLLVFFNITRLNEAMNWNLLGRQQGIQHSPNTVHDPNFYLPKGVVVKGNKVNWIRTCHTETKILSCYSAPDNIWKVKNETNNPIKFTIQTSGQEYPGSQSTIQPSEEIVTGIPGSSEILLDVHSWGQVI